MNSLTPRSFGSTPTTPAAIALGIALLGAGAPLQAQAAWTLQAPQHRPPARAYAASTFDATRGEVLVFGGWSDANGITMRNDTWAWDGLDWHERQSPSTPSARSSPGLAFDRNRGRAVLFGGTGPSTSYPGIPLGDTWEWDGVAWLARTPVHAPAPRLPGAMAYDETRGEVVLFGGGIAYGPHYNDTWVWNGTDWVQRVTANAPSPRFASAMVFDAARGHLVLYGGRSEGLSGPGTMSRFLDTWTHDGVDWTRRSPAHDAQDRDFHQMTYDRRRQRVVLFGSAYYLYDTREWNGVDWYGSNNCPVELVSPTFVYDEVRDACVLTGGIGLGGWSDQTWLYRKTVLFAAFTPFGQGCPGSLGVPVLDAANQPRLGSLFDVVCSNLPADRTTMLWLGFSRTGWNGAPLPLDLSQLGMPGCTLFVSGDLVANLLNWQGTAHWHLAIPNSQSLAGLQTYVQAAVVDRVNALGLVVTNAGAMRIGN
ncbi:MAG: hypothetical protein JNK49_11690 [Planctomycetes bacterium]|nr:hypothetical protein [Planctomycetota bacterium]